MVFLVGQEFEEFPGKITNEIINMASSDGFKIINIDNVFNVYSVGGNGIDKYVFTCDDHQECVDLISSIMKIHVTNEPHTVVTMDEFEDTTGDIQDKDELLDVMIELLRRYGHDDIVDQFITMEYEEIAEDENMSTDIPVEDDDISIDTPINSGGDRYTIEVEKFR